MSVVKQTPKYGKFPNYNLLPRNANSYSEILKSAVIYWRTGGKTPVSKFWIIVM